ncbi:hypothetical protein [Pseudarthrobacter sp. H2]|uniref:hypothetical protein n=1 Tax=Pseudarthrobacter sp. H2 TaxID=3418415 RepID=UPI003CED2D77
MAEGDVRRGGWEPAAAPSWTSAMEGVIGVALDPRDMVLAKHDGVAGTIECMAPASGDVLGCRNAG